MHRSTLSVLALSLTAGLLLTSCEPTPRTAIDKKKNNGSTPAPAQPEPAPAPTATPAPTPEVKPVETAPARASSPIDSLVDITATRQEYDIVRPWEKKPTSQTSARGIYLGDGLVLTVGDVGKAATYIEMSLPNGAQKASARIVKHDEDRDLTLLELQHKEKNKDFFASRQALSLGTPLQIASQASLWKIIRGNQPQQIDISVERASEANYSSPRLIASSSLAMDDSDAAGLPVVKDGKLAALTLSYNDKLQTLSLVNAELIRNFLQESDPSKMGSPILGVERSLVKDPVLLRYLKVDEKTPGFYISKVYEGGTAHQSGLQQGDLILEIDGHKIDSRGQSEHPLYGSLDGFAFAQGMHQVGEQVPIKVARDGKIIDITLKLNRDLLQKALFRSVTAGEPPRYVLHGGLLFQPVTSDYISAVQGKMRGSLPAEYLELEKRRAEFAKRGYKELVALSLVLPTPATLGYNSVGLSFVEKVNGKEVHSLEQLASLLDEPTPDGLIRITINKPPYDLFLDRKLAEMSNDKLRRIDIPALRKLDETKD